jgi:hypothetical protein
LSEIQPNVGILSDYDSGGIADIKILDNAKRDTSITAKYNDKSYSVVVKYHTATLTMGTPQNNTPNKPSPSLKQIVSKDTSTESALLLLLKLAVVKSLLPY